MQPPQIPLGYRLTGVHCGVKRNPEKLDLSLFVSDRPATVVGVYTANLVCAAPVQYDRARTPAEGFRVVVANSGNANACTGERGLDDASVMADESAHAIGAASGSGLVLSTGVIGQYLPLDRIRGGIRAAAGELGRSAEHLDRAAHGILTTDTVTKVVGRRIALDGHEITLLGIAKGAAMIAPNLATMLGVVLCDAALDPSAAQEALTEAVTESFNCVTIDGHMSTNDTVLLMANGAAGTEPLQGADLAAFRAELTEICGELARAIAADGEGATHLITIDITGCTTRDSAARIARSIAESPLVKTAIAGADPNWGRIVSAAGYAGVPLDPQRLTLWVNEQLLFREGQPTAFDPAAVSRSIRENRDTHVRLDVAAGSSAVRFWTTDLTAEYVRLNADYTT